MSGKIDFRSNDRNNRDRSEHGHWLFAQDCSFVMSVTSELKLPLSKLDEVAFAGRSNVGKSSLINALTNQKMLARTSNTPGRTQQINFFNLHEELMIVDLPGYGFARAPKSLIKQWTRLVDYYLTHRPQLRRVCLLVDARHGFKKGDQIIMDMLDRTGTSYQVILTKSDKVNEDQVLLLVQQTNKELKTRIAAHPDIIVTSSAKKIGLSILRTELTKLATKKFLM